MAPSLSWQRWRVRICLFYRLHRCRRLFCPASFRFLANNFGIIESHRLAGLFALPETTLNQSRAFYGLIGVLIGLVTFARASSWVVRTTTRLLSRLVSHIVSEIINQFTQLTSRGLSLWPAPSKQDPQERGALPNANNGVGGAIILDTSSIIDGRILDVAKTGFLSGVLLIPNFVLTELQQVADSADSLKRARGRRGFEIIDEIKKISGIKIQVWDKELAGKTVDDKLVRLGKILRGKILTCDFNMNRVARINGVRVLNLNDLGNALKTLPIPGEKLNTKIVHLGKDKDQGVGYLTDGTMVVVKGANSLVGHEVDIEINRVIQGPAGRMIFGKKLDT